MAFQVDDELAHAVRAAGIETPVQFHALVLQLTAVERALFMPLAETAGPVSALELRERSHGLLSNVSLVARQVNRKLEAAGDERRVVCTVSPRHAGRGSVAHWRLEVFDAQQAS